MSYDSVGASREEDTFLRANGFRSSPFEGLSEGGRYHGFWTHPEMPEGLAHLSTQEALEWLRERQKSFSEFAAHTSSDFKQRGATLFEALVVIFIFLVFAGVIGGGCLELTGIPQDLRRENAQKQAHNWLHEFRQDLQSPRVSCMGTDTDRNGYVTCQVGDGHNHTVQIECRSCAWICAGVGPSDCREYRVFTPQFVQPGQ